MTATRAWHAQHKPHSSGGLFRRGRPRRLSGCAQCTSQSGQDAPPAAQTQQSKEDALTARIAAAKSYKQKQRDEANSMIAQAAATKESNTGLRPEMETMMKENAPREVEFISVDKTYKPKTTSWGVFERPVDISAAYGGGRNLQPGQPLETEAESAARLAKVRTAMMAFKKAQGMDLSDEVAGKVADAMQRGEAAFTGGRLERAAIAFREAADLAPLRSEPGGQARLRLALCMDSCGNSAEAKELYTALGSHPNAEIKKQASRLLWGMTEATAFLKAEAFDYTESAGVRREYQKYLEQLVNPWDTALPEDEEETRRLNAIAIASAAMLVALPVGLLAVLRTAAHRVTLQL